MPVTKRDMQKEIEYLSKVMAEFIKLGTDLEQRIEKIEDLLEVKDDKKIILQ